MAHFDLSYSRMLLMIAGQLLMIFFIVTFLFFDMGSDPMNISKGVRQMMGNSAFWGSSSSSSSSSTSTPGKVNADTQTMLTNGRQSIHVRP